MIERLASLDSIKDAERRIRELIDGHGEWLCVQEAQGSATTLRKGECDFRVSHGRLIFSCWNDEGALAWRITAWEWTGEKLLLEATRRAGTLSAQLELIPRASIEAMAATISATRRERCRQLAQLACAPLQGAKIERACLSAGSRPGHPGRYARIMLRRSLERIAVTGTVAESKRNDVDAFVSSALIWFTRVSERARQPYIQKLWLIVEKDSVEALRERLALLRDGLRRVIALYQIDEGWQELTRIQMPSLGELWEAAPKRFRRPAPGTLSESAARIMSLAPEAVDVVRSRHGETVRFHGLSFARVRRLMNRENVWFGVEGARRRLLDESTRGEWAKLLQDLKEHRRASVPDKNHALYRASPEAWLESLLRRDIRQLDPGLRLAPLYAQFRPSHAGGARPIDLLALRRDGRLVVIELKVSEDREHVLQGADYWRRVEAHRRRSHISQSKIFGEAEIADEPPLVYLVAPTLRFHRAFDTLARAITPTIKIFRFDINEDWRAGVRVMRRCDLT
ncbi:MAG: hypothetical protein QOJ02_4140 [Acidobacteriota bacterium]|jgi:hypothetical protein|nr:hypothetical protein [Acidobacteriota bacterium]